MRIFHTADWHIGQTLAGHGREHEHGAVLGELIELVGALAPDALLVSGDVFDHQNPSGEALKLYYQTLAGLKRAQPKMTIIVTAGNHDAAGRLEAPMALLDAMDVHVVGSVRRTADGVDASRHLIALKAGDGKIGAEVLAVSYPTASCLPPFASLDMADGTSPIIEGTRALYADLYQRSGAGKRGVPVIVMGHLHVAGGIETEGAERRILVGGQHAVGPDVFPAAAYVALGHLHKAQAIGSPHIRYSGSLIPLSASELGYAHGVTMVTLSRGKTDIEHIALKRPLPFLRMPAKGEIGFDDLEAALRALNLPAAAEVSLRPFVQVHLARAGLPPGFRAAIDDMADVCGVRIVDVRLASLPAGDAAVATDASARLADLKPDDLFADAFRRTHGRAPEAAHLDAFHLIVAAASVEA